MGISPNLFAADVGDLEHADFLRVRQASQVAVADGAVRSVVIRDLEGDVHFTQGRDAPGPIQSEDRAFAAALAGEVWVELVADPTAPSGFEIRVDQPLEVDSHGRRTGVLQLGLPYEGIAELQQAKLRRTYALLGLALVVFYLTQALVARWTTQRLRRMAADDEYQATHDSPTGLPNRRLFMRRAAQLLQTQPGMGVSVLVLVDLDHFKAVNDTMGHGAGDELLRVAARRLIESLRADDLVARLGGDEFGLVLQGAWGMSQGAGDVARMRLVERVRTHLCREFVFCDAPICVQASFGVTLLDPLAGGVDLALTRADMAMYEAKRRGSGIVDWTEQLVKEHDRRRRGLVPSLGQIPAPVVARPPLSS
jgi:diguanylate cyclase (GGDEF)-like protein